MRQQDGLNRLHRSIEDTAKVKSNDLAVYHEGVELLAAEKAEDLAARNKYGTDRWTRGTSESAAPKIYRTLNEISGYFTSAQSSDDLVQRKLRDQRSVFLVLTGTNRDLEAFVPSSRRAAIPIELERESNRLRGCLSEITRMENRRRRRIQTLKDKARGDDIRTPICSTHQPTDHMLTYRVDPALLRETARLEREFPMQPIQASQFEDLFVEELKLYDTDRDMLAQERRDQEHLSDQVREANRAFTGAHKGDASTKERETALQDLENGYLKYKEIISNIDVGRKFYNDLAKIVGRFRDDGKAFVHQRRMEASQIETYVLESRTNKTSSADFTPQRHLQRSGHGFTAHHPTASPSATPATSARTPLPLLVYSLSAAYKSPSPSHGTAASPRTGCPAPSVSPRWYAWNVVP